MEDLEQEQLRTINLNTRNKIISTRMIYQGSVNNVSMRVGEVFRPALIDNATCLIVLHNHPGQDPSANPEDLPMTRELVRAGKLLGVEVLDHIIISTSRNQVWARTQMEVTLLPVLCVSRLLPSRRRPATRQWART